MRLVAVVCYLVALAGSGVFVLFVLALGLDLWPGPLLAFEAGWWINAGWLGLFAVQHSLMARESFKRVWRRVIPPALERSLYACLSGLLLLALPVVWQPTPGCEETPLLSGEGSQQIRPPLSASGRGLGGGVIGSCEPLWRLPSAFIVAPLLAGLALALINARYDHAGLFGVRQAWTDRPEEGETLIRTGPYRCVRHPLMACTLLFLWTQPVMTPTLALLAGGLTAYILLGVALEERDLMRRFAPAYAGYRRRVPLLIPWRRPLQDEEVLS